MGDGAFDNGRVINSDSCTVYQSEGVIYSYRVTALNKGGESFPSETLSVCKQTDERGRVAIINGFERVSAPLSLRSDDFEGFLCDEDSGVAYLQDVAYIGRQRVFDPALRRSSDHSAALGASYCDAEGQIVGGNTFDYPALHGRSIAAAGYSFISTSAKAVEEGVISLDGYGAVDLILGKQRTVSLGSGHYGYDFECFSKPLQSVLRNYTECGGNIFVSGSYIATDLWHGAKSDEADRAFAREVLHFEYGGGATIRRGEIKSAPSPAKISGRYAFATEPSAECYTIDNPDVLRPSNGAMPAMRYVENNRIAGVAWSGDYRTISLGVPFECITDTARRDALMRSVMEYLFRQGGTDYMQ